MNSLHSWDFPLDRKEKLWRLIHLCQRDLVLGPLDDKCSPRRQPSRNSWGVASFVPRVSAWEFPLSRDEKTWRLLGLFAPEPGSAAESACDTDEQEPPSGADVCGDVAWEVTVTRFGAWDFPLSRHEHLSHALSSIHGAGSSGQLPHVIGPELLASHGGAVLDLLTGSGRAWEVPMSQAEKVNRLLMRAAVVADAAAVEEVHPALGQDDALALATCERTEQDSSFTRLASKSKRRRLSCKLAAVAFSVADVCLVAGWLAAVAFSVASARSGRRMEVRFSWT